MAVRSRHLWQHAFSSTGWQQVYVVPTDRTALVKGAIIYNHGLAASTVGFAVAASSPTTAGQIVWEDSAPSGRGLVLPVLLVLEEGEKLWALNTSGSGSSNGSGSLLLGDPS